MPGLNRNHKFTPLDVSDSRIIHIIQCVMTVSGIRPCHVCHSQVKHTAMKIKIRVST